MKVELMVDHGMEQLARAPDEKAAEFWRQFIRNWEDIILKQLEIDLVDKQLLQHSEKAVPSGTPADHSGAFLRSLFTSQSPPPPFESFPTLSILKRPLPIRSTTLDRLKAECNLEDHGLLQSLVKVCDGPTPDPEPAYHLADTLYSSIFPSSKANERNEQIAMTNLHNIVCRPMQEALSSLHQDHRLDVANADSSTATTGTQTPNLLLFLNDVLMWKAEGKRGGTTLHKAVAELQNKTNNWSPACHGNHQYMVCCGITGSRLQFYIVTRGGVTIKSVSRILNLSRILDRIKAIHFSLVALDIIQRQFRIEVPCNPIPMYKTVNHEEHHTTFRYGYKDVRKSVVWEHGPTSDKDTLIKVYTKLLALPHGEGLQHPRGLLLPTEMPSLSEGATPRWSVKMPMARTEGPSTANQLRQLVIDVLHGLGSLHGVGLVHRDVRAPNILQSGSSFVLMDYELAGTEGDAPVFANPLLPCEPLRHWPEECQTPGAPYSAAADMHGLGKVLLTYDCYLPQSAQPLPLWLVHSDFHQRPTAGEALAWVEANWHITNE